MERSLVCGAILAGWGVATSSTEAVMLAASLLVIAVASIGIRPRDRSPPPPPMPRVELDPGQDAHDPPRSLTIQPAPPRSPLALWAVSLPAPAGATVGPAWPRAMLATPAQTLHVPLSTRRWGRTGLGTLTWATTDLLGAWRSSGSLEAPTITSRPPARELRATSIVHQPSGTAGRHRSARRGPGAEIADIRAWQVGDAARRVHWRATARTGQLQVSTTHAERDASVLIAIDSRTVVGGRDRRDTVDVACEAASALVHHFVRAGDRVAFADLGGRVPPVAFGTGRRVTHATLEALSAIDRERPASAVVELPPLRPGTLVLVASPLLDEATLTALGALVTAGCSVACVDTLPAALPRSPAEPTDLALHLRALERSALLLALTRQGIPVVTWHSPSTLVALLHLTGTRAGARR